MTTATLDRPPTQARTGSPESQLAAYEDLIRDAVRHCGQRDRRQLDLEDMHQDARIAVWKVLRKEPDTHPKVIWTVAYHAAVHSLRQGKSVDRPITRGPVRYQVVTLDRLMEDPDGLDIVEMALARYRRHGEMPNPTEDVAVTSVMLQELWDVLTPKQRQVLALRLQQNSEQETGETLGMFQSDVHQVCMRIRKKAQMVWGDEPPPRKPTPAEIKEREREQARLKMRERYAQHREEFKSRGRVRKNAERAAWREQGRCSRCGGIPEPGHKLCPDCQMKSRLERRRAKKRAARSSPLVVNRNGSRLCDISADGRTTGKEVAIGQDHQDQGRPI